MRLEARQLQDQDTQAYMTSKIWQREEECKDVDKRVLQQKDGISNDLKDAKTLGEVNETGLQEFAMT